MIVKANDKGSPSLEGTCAFVVNVGDVNDNNPIFDKSVSSFLVFTVLHPSVATKFRGLSRVCFMSLKTLSRMCVLCLFMVFVRAKRIMTLV